MQIKAKFLFEKAKESQYIYEVSSRGLSAVDESIQKSLNSKIL